MKNLINMVMVVVAAAALMQLYRANMELKYNNEALTSQINDESALYTQCIVKSCEQTHHDTQKIAELECKLKALAANKIDTPAIFTRRADVKS